MPFLLFIALNVVNFAYFFLVALNLTAAPRSGTLYSILGDSTPASSQSGFSGLPAAGPLTTTTSVSYLTVNDLNGAVHQATTTAGVQVCSSTVGLSSSGTANQTAKCDQYQGATSRTPDTDLEAPLFVLDRVDIQYQFTPLIPGTPFNILLLSSPICSSSSGVTCTFHRMSEMREMN